MFLVISIRNSWPSLNWICSYIAYRYTCSNYKVMVKRTTTFLSAAGHMAISNLTEKCLKNVKQSAISDHLLDCNCSIDFNHFDILASDAN